MTGSTSRAGSVRLTGDGTPRSVILDGLRGVAVLPVLGYHFGLRFFGGGWLGVDVFFVVSGFVMTTSVLRALSRNSWSTKRYIVRRCTRLLPVITVAVFAVIVGTAIDRRTGIPWVEAGAALTMTYNFAFEFLDIEGNHLRHIWSLAIEWHFYLSIPLVVPLLGSGRRRLLQVAGAVVTLIVLVRIATVIAFPRPFFVYVLTPFRVDGLLLGCMVALSPRELLGRVSGWLSTAALGTLVVVLTVPARWGDALVVSLGVLIVVANVATATVVAVDADGRTPAFVERILGSAPIQWAGTRSYSLYVWHFIVGVGFVNVGDESFQGPMTLVLQIVLSLVVAEASFRLVEMPAQRALNARFQPR